jgi:hypothetical protein
MATAPLQRCAISARANGRVSDSLYVGSIEANEGIDFFGPGTFLEEVADSTKVSFALFANRGDKKDRAFRFDTSGVQRFCYGKYRHKTAAIIGDSRSVKLSIPRTYCEIGSGGENRIEVCAYDKQRMRPASFSQPKAVPFLIDS